MTKSNANLRIVRSCCLITQAFIVDEGKGRLVPDLLDLHKCTFLIELYPLNPFKALSLHLSWRLELQPAMLIGFIIFIVKRYLRYIVKATGGLSS